MRILNLYFSATGNTDKVAKQIENASMEMGHDVHTVKASPNIQLDILTYDFVFVGSGVYTWMPGKPMMELLAKTRERYGQSGQIMPAAPRKFGRKAVVYCTFGGGHTGTNEAQPAVKYMGQLFDHLGYEIVCEWFIVGEFHGKLEHLSTAGRMGNIKGRPNEDDLKDVYERTRGILLV